MKLKLISLAIFSALVLQACGGSDSKGTPENNSSGQTNTQGTANDQVGRDQNTGKVDQNFIATANAKYIVFPNNGFSTGGLNISETPQNSDGSFKNLGEYSLTGDKVAVQDIAGNADYAIGRWSWGTVNDQDSSSDSGQSHELQNIRNDYVNYAVFNQFESASLGKKTCTARAFTQPYLVNSANDNDPVLATTTGTATFDLVSLNEAKFEISLKTDNGKNSRTSSFYPGKPADYANGGINIISHASSVDPTNSFISNGEYQVSIGQGLAGDIILIANYRNQLGDNAPAYSGLAVFSCK